MAVSLQLGLKQNQKLILTQSLKQAIELLQLSTLELADKISEELLNNPVLEEGEQSSSSDIDNGNLVTEVSQNLSGDESTLNRAEEDLDKYGDMGETPFSISVEQDKKRDYLESVVAHVESLSEHLMWQAQLTAENEEELFLYESIITSLDPSGFYTQEIPDMTGRKSVSTDLFEQVITKIRHFDPVGCACSNVQESLLIQAKYYYPDDMVMQRILSDHFIDLENLNYEKIARGINKSVGEIIETSKMIQNLDPFPGRQFRSNEVRYIVPDIDVKYVDGEIIVAMNDDWIPPIRINSYYVEILRKKSIEKNLKDYIQDKLQSAKYLIKNIASRRETIIKVVAAIMEAQKPFLIKGPGNLKPLTHVEIAEKIGMHESTVSRATTHKFVQTSWGVFELKYFFVSKLKSANTREQSSDQVMNLVKNLIDNEDHREPLTDDDIVSVLKKNGINVARRTISKYRSVLNIPPSHKRKKINMIKSEGNL